jgi:peptidoglycan/xylan/chitin deacetylase (PgdA/CDA1 family)
MVDHSFSFRADPPPSVGRAPRSGTQKSTLRSRGRHGARAVAEVLLPASVVAFRGPRVAAARGGRVALTFDDGPTPLTPDYLSVLAQYGARATFFLVGKHCVESPNLVQAIVDAGHEVAGHGYTHRRFSRLSARELGDELEQTHRLLPSDGRKRPFVRPPHGDISVGSTLKTLTTGFTTVLWSYDSGDWATQQADPIARRFVEHPVAAGDIVLLHEGQSWTLDALPRILSTLNEAGHELVTAGELLGR